MPPTAYLINCRIVYNLVGDVQLEVWILVACLICHLHCTLYAPAVPIRLCQLYGCFLSEDNGNG